MNSTRLTPRTVPLSLPSIGPEEKQAVLEVLDSGWLTHGPKNQEFEKAFAEYHSVTHAVSMNSCASALQAAVELTWDCFMHFRRRVSQSKLDLMALLKDIRGRGEKVYGIGAPSRASTLVNYVGLDDSLIDCMLEIQGSSKIAKMMPGTLIPVLEESLLFRDQPEYALLFSWHIADELVPKLRQKGYAGRFIVPLPTPRIIHPTDQVAPAHTGARLCGGSAAEPGANPRGTSWFTCIRVSLLGECSWLTSTGSGGHSGKQAMSTWPSTRCC